MTGSTHKAELTAQNRRETMIDELKGKFGEGGFMAKAQIVSKFGTESLTDVKRLASEAPNPAEIKIALVQAEKILKKLRARRDRLSEEMDSLLGKRPSLNRDLKLQATESLLDNDNTMKSVQFEIDRITSRLELLSMGLPGFELKLESAADVVRFLAEELTAAETIGPYFASLEAVMEYDASYEVSSECKEPLPRSLSEPVIRLGVKLGRDRAFMGWLRVAEESLRSFTQMSGQTILQTKTA